MNQGTIEGQVNAGCLVFTSAACGDQDKRDARDIMLYTQLAASKKHARLEASDSWRQTWLAALNRFGWPMRNTENLNLPPSVLPVGTIGDWLSARLPAFMPQVLWRDSEALMRRSLSAHPLQPALAMLAGQVIEPLPEHASTQMAPTRRLGLQFAFYEPGSGLYLVVLTLKTRQRLTPEFLIEQLDPREMIGNIDIGFYSVHRMEQVYGQFRKTIGHALEDRRADAVHLLWEGSDVCLA